MFAGIDLYIVYALLFVSLYFEVFLLASFIERRLRKAARIDRADPLALPTIAIVVPCFNEGKTLATTVSSLLELDYPAEKLEIIVVDDGSRDNTLEVARTFENAAAGGEHFSDEDLVRSREAASPADGKMFAPRPCVKVFHKENGGKHTAMNLALAHTQAEFIGCLDADSIVELDALREMMPVFADVRVAAATPGIHVRDPRTLLQKIQHVEYRLALFNRFVLAAVGSAFITPGPLSVFRADVVRKLGGWRHGHATEDMEMALRVQEAGFLIANVPSAIVHTTTPRTVRGLFHQRVRWTYGWLRNAVDYRYMFGNSEYGNLGLLILPSAIISIFAGIYFFARIVYYSARAIIDITQRTLETGILPHPSLQFFYFNTSALWFLIYMSVALIFCLLCAGTMIGTEDKHFPPRATPLFMLFYSFLVPLWLGTAVVRAVFKTGVKWR